MSIVCHGGVRSPIALAIATEGDDRARQAQQRQAARFRYCRDGNQATIEADGVERYRIGCRVFEERIQIVL